MPVLVQQRQKRKAAVRRWAAACGGLLAVLVLAASAQTAAPAGETPPAATPPQTNLVNQAAAPNSTNTVSLVETLQNDPGFQSYTNLLEHSLFVPASEIGGSGDSDDLGPKFAGGLRLTGFFVRGAKIEASLEDRNEPDKKFFVEAGDIIKDGELIKVRDLKKHGAIMDGTEIKVVGFNLRGRAIHLKKGDDEDWLEYESEAMPAPAATAKPGAPGTPTVPGAPGAAMQRPGMPPTMSPQAGMAGGPRPGPFGPRAGGGGDDSASQGSRKQSRQQTIARLQEMMKNTPDAAARQRLKNYIEMLEKSNARD
jgi:hypothetical protein